MLFGEPKTQTAIFHSSCWASKLYEHSRRFERVWRTSDEKKNSEHVGKWRYLCRIDFYLVTQGFWFSGACVASLVRGVGKAALISKKRGSFLIPVPREINMKSLRFVT